MKKFPNDLDETEIDPEFQQEQEETTMLEPFVEVLPVVADRGGARVLPPDPVKKTKKVAWLALLISVVSVAFTGGGVYLLHSILEETESMDNAATPEISLNMPPEGHFIEYQGLNIPVMPTVPMNSYDARGFYLDVNDFMHYEVDGFKGILGIDVSVYQSSIDWKAVAEAGIEFAMIRVGWRGYGSEGALGMDQYYVENLVGAQQNGIETGVYFFSQATNIIEVDEEVDLLLSLIQNYDITYPVVFDWEHITTDDNPRTKNTTGEEITAMAKRFCERIEVAGYTPMVYFNVDMAYRDMDLSQLMDYPFWLAELNSFPRFYYHFDMWQYTFTGNVPGIEGPVDMNLSFRDFAAESQTE